MTNYAIALLVTLALGTLAFGAVYPWAYWPMAAACAALGVVGLLRSPGWFQGRMKGLTIAVAVVAGAITLQLVPLPFAVFRAVSPNADRFLAQFSLAYSAQPPAWHALTVAPEDTAIVLALFLLFGVFLVGLATSVGRLSLPRLVTSLALFGVAVAVVGVIGRVPESDKQTHFTVYGFWHTEQGGHPFPPFVNPNHYAGWMLLVIALALGYLGGLIHDSLAEHEGDVRRWMVWLARPEAGRLALVALCVMAMATALVLTGSRSGVAALGVVLLAFGARSAASVRGVRARIVALAVVASAFVGAVAWAGAGPILSKFSHAVGDASTTGRTGVWQDALHIFRDFPLFGSGMGTFAQLMLFYQTGTREAYYTQAHNDYLQVLAEGGLLVALAAAAFIVVVARIARQRLREDSKPLVSWIRFGAVAGLLGIAAQSTVEFSLQMPAVAALFVVLIAVAIHRPSSQSPHAHRL